MNYRFGKGSYVLIVAFVVAVGVIIVGFFVMRVGNGESSRDMVYETTFPKQHIEMDSPFFRSAEVQLKPIGAYDGSGAVRIKETSNGLLFEMEFSPMSVADEHPVHIHQGRCGEQTTALFTLESVSLESTLSLSNNAVGSAKTILDISFDELYRTTPRSITVHLSPDEANRYIACGELVRPEPFPDQVGTLLKEAFLVATSTLEVREVVGMKKEGEKNAISGYRFLNISEGRMLAGTINRTSAEGQIFLINKDATIHILRVHFEKLPVLKIGAHYGIWLADTRNMSGLMLVGTFDNDGSEDRQYSIVGPLVKTYDLVLVTTMQADIMETMPDKTNTLFMAPLPTKKVSLGQDDAD